MTHLITMFRNASILSRILVGVLTAGLITGMAFSYRVYAFMAQGPRFTAGDYYELESVAEDRYDERYVNVKVYMADQRRVEETLERIERKLDRALKEIE